MNRTIAALYDDRNDADQARRDLEAAGIPGSQINISDSQGGQEATVSTEPRESHGFLDWLFGVPEEDVRVYQTGVERGKTLVTVRADEGQLDQVTTILERYRPVDMEANAGTEARAGGSVEEARIPVVEEELAVGKREVVRGGARVRSYVVERPVEQEVQLRDETVRVERRPASGTAGVGDDAFKERSFEVTERDEEAVVSKTPRVREEVVVSKDVDQRTERVRDKVRRTEVEVEKAGAGEEKSR